MQKSSPEQAVEEIARALDHGVSVEDLDGDLIAYSSHQASADPVRVNFLLTKKVPADVSAWQLSHGIATAVRPVVVGANESLGMLGRVCVPLLVRGFRVGYLWVLQQPGEEADGILAALPAVRPLLDGLAAELLDTNTPESEARRRREAQFLAACTGDNAAVEDVAGWPEVSGRAPWAVGVIMERIDDPDVAMAELADPEAAVLLQRVSALQATVGIRPALFSAGAPQHAVLLFRDMAGRSEHAEVLQRYGTEISRRGGHPERPDMLGLSEPFADLRRLPEAYREATTAVQAASVDPRIGPLADFRNTGVYQLLAQARGLLPTGSVRYQELADRDPNGELLTVLELLYDTDGSVAEAAASLHLHRSSVYNRLAKVRSIVGADPLKGSTRLELHLALKAARWARRPRLSF
ncbi:PucR family transcripitonal regulator [Arthrobacter crystallopoietes BAB-32]|uniref:PucR family transcripitonal regulator n=1 Tax=Arthrobacter crystallopoietes BAB-32 TaxID=1246476 RepID=N1V0T7_9MICC|nr:PucR family transcriptional regulator [Arthrobacter crystallopoietes]EMY36256.1 PucR family transcripitonal regulator [Arthrobacter crystallopoietes BAB-32]